MTKSCLERGGSGSLEILTTIVSRLDRLLGHRTQKFGLRNISVYISFYIKYHFPVKQRKGDSFSEWNQIKRVGGESLFGFKR